MGHVVRNLKKKVVGLVACDNPNCPEESKLDINKVFNETPSSALLAEAETEEEKLKYQHEKSSHN